MDWVGRLRELVRLEWPAEVRLLVSTLGEDELDRLRELLRTWPAGCGWPPDRAAVRGCLDRVEEAGR